MTDFPGWRQRWISIEEAKQRWPREGDELDAMEKRIAELEALLSEWRDTYRAINRDHMYSGDSLPGRTDAALRKSD